MQVTDKPLDNIAAGSVFCIECQATFNGKAIVFDSALTIPVRM